MYWAYKLANAENDAESKEIVTGLPKFKVEGMQKNCEECQFGKQARGAFPHDKNVTRTYLMLYI